MKILPAPSRGPDRGSAALIALITILVIGSLVAVVLMTTQRHAGEVAATVDRDRAFFVAQAGANDALARLETGAEESLGSPEEPLAFGGGEYWVEVADEGDDLFRVTSHARVGLQRRSLEAIARVLEPGVFHHGIFAGNSSGDPGYVLELGGRLAQADRIVGDVYSGGSVDIGGDAEVEGTIRAAMSASGNGALAAETGERQGIPDLIGMDYAATAGVRVADEFDSGGAQYLTSSAGGRAWQLPESNPAHVFRKNPSDRTTETSGTAKDDYFLEDPYEPMRGDALSDGSDAYAITLSGVGGEPGRSSNGQVFYVDGNLWVHNYKTLSLKFAHSEASGIQVTFVASGNIYFSDNVFYSNDAKDGVAFIAMKDPRVADSGNIYFGDPEFGTLEEMHAFMYAENNFHDVNLSATGSASVELYGNMTAGNQVVIQRDFRTSVGGVEVDQHSRLFIDFDERIANGEIDMPGLPGTPAVDDGDFEVLSWREVARP